MKFRYFLLTGLALASLTACNDYLDVDAPSKQTNEYIFTKESEIKTALNNVYVQLFSNDTYGQTFWVGLTMNSDVEFAANSSEVATETGYQRFECTSQGSGINKAWTALYKGIETANNFIYNLERSGLYRDADEEVVQMMGEAKCLRAIFVSDLVWYFGDVPFSLEPTYYREGDFVLPVVDRNKILDDIIADLKEIAPRMKSTSACTVERCSQEFANAMIARLSLQAGGYTLRPDTNNPLMRGVMSRPENYKAYYQDAMEYAGKVISAGTHSLAKPFKQVFIDECNYVVDNSDDPVFEIPFAYKSSGNIGYNQGPSCSLYEGSTTGINIWGASSGNARLNAFYRFTFDTLDVRRDYVNGLWYYQYDGTPIMRADYSVHNNKWSKFWSNLNTDPTSEGSTGINFPYMRYADVLLMYAEAANEVNNGPTDAAKNAVKEVRKRAFPSDSWADKVDAYVDNANTKDLFLNIVLNERKWELAGENSRWRDLVRNNKYAEVLYWTFLRYLAMGEEAGGSSDYMDAVSAYDGVPGSMDLPTYMWYNIVPNPKNSDIYPNTQLDVMDIFNPYENVRTHTGYNNYANFYAWWNDGVGAPRAQCLYSLFGFARGDEQGRAFLVNNSGALTPLPFPISDYSQLPVVRYILPYPNAAIQRSAGAYKNYYGYAN